MVGEILIWLILLGFGWGFFLLLMLPAYRSQKDRSSNQFLSWLFSPCLLIARCLAFIVIAAVGSVILLILMFGRMILPPLNRWLKKMEEDNKKFNQLLSRFGNWVMFSRSILPFSDKKN